MAANGHRVMTVSPRYDQYKDAWDTEVELEAGDKTEKVRFFHCYKRGVDRVFVDHPMFLDKVWGRTTSKKLMDPLLELTTRTINLDSAYYAGNFGGPQGCYI